MDLRGKKRQVKVEKCMEMEVNPWQILKFFRLVNYKQEMVLIIPNQNKNPSLCGILENVAYKIINASHILFLFVGEFITICL